MAIEFKDSGSCVECISSIKSKAFIWLSSEKYKGLTFMCGDFTADDLEQILTKMKELQSNNVNRNIPKQTTQS